MPKCDLLGIWCWQGGSSWLPERTAHRPHHYARAHAHKWMARCSASPPTASRSPCANDPGSLQKAWASLPGSLNTELGVAQQQLVSTKSQHRESEVARQGASLGVEPAAPVLQLSTTGWRSDWGEHRFFRAPQGLSVLPNKKP